EKGVVVQIEKPLRVGRIRVAGAFGHRKRAVNIAEPPAGTKFIRDVAEGWDELQGGVCCTPVGHEDAAALNHKITQPGGWIYRAPVENRIAVSSGLNVPDEVLHRHRFVLFVKFHLDVAEDGAELRERSRPSRAWRGHGNDQE